MNNVNNYKEKYLKYKLKYLDLQNNSNIHNNLIKKYKSKLKIIKGGAISDLEEYLNSQGVNLEVKNVPDDGNCLFYAIIDQLQLFKISENMDIDDLRASAVDWLSKNANNSYSTGPGENLTIKETVLFDVSVLEPLGIRKKDNNKWETYITKMKQKRVWGDRYIIHAIHEMLQINIIIYTDTEYSTRYMNEGYTNIITIGFVNNNHYVSLVPKEVVALAEDIKNDSDKSNKRKKIKYNAPKSNIEDFNDADDDTMSVDYTHTNTILILPVVGIITASIFLAISS
jgi:hypothetical protein